MGDGENGVKLPTHDTLCTEWRFGSGLKVWNAILQVIQNWKGYCQLLQIFDNFGENGEG